MAVARVRAMRPSLLTTTCIAPRLLPQRPFWEHIYAKQRPLHARSKQYSDQRQQFKPSTRQSEKDDQHEMVPKVNFRDMFDKTSPWVKGVVYVAIAVIATAETYTYSIWIWHSLYPPQTPAAKEGKDVAS